MSSKEKSDLRHSMPNSAVQYMQSDEGDVGSEHSAPGTESPNHDTPYDAPVQRYAKTAYYNHASEKTMSHTGKQMSSMPTLLH